MSHCTAVQTRSLSESLETFAITTNGHIHNRPNMLPPTKPSLKTVKKLISKHPSEFGMTSQEFYDSITQIDHSAKTRPLYLKPRHCYKICAVMQVSLAELEDVMCQSSNTLFDIYQTIDPMEKVCKVMHYLEWVNHCIDLLCQHAAKQTPSKTRRDEALEQFAWTHTCQLWSKFVTDLSPKVYGYLFNDIDRLIIHASKPRASWFKPDMVILMSLLRHIMMPRLALSSQLDGVTMSKLLGHLLSQIGVAKKSTFFAHQNCPPPQGFIEINSFLDDFKEFLENRTHYYQAFDPQVFILVALEKIEFVMNLSKQLTSFSCDKSDSVQMNLSMGCQQNCSAAIFALLELIAAQEYGNGSNIGDRLKEPLCTKNIDIILLALFHLYEYDTDSISHIGPRWSHIKRMFDGLVWTWMKRSKGRLTDHLGLVIQEATKRANISASRFLQHLIYCHNKLMPELEDEQVKLRGIRVNPVTKMRF